MINVQWPPADPGWPAGRPSMRRRTPYPAGRKPACSQNGRDNGLAVSKSTARTHALLISQRADPVEPGQAYSQGVARLAAADHQEGTP